MQLGDDPGDEAEAELRAGACRCRSTPRRSAPRGPGRCAGRRGRRRSSADQQARRDHHEQRAQDVAAGDHARALGRLGALLDEGVERHDEEAAEQREQRQVERDAQPPGCARNCADRRAAPPVRRRRGGTPTRKRSSANSVMPIEPSGTRPSSSLRPESTLAEQRADADADAEQRQEERDRRARRRAARRGCRSAAAPGSTRRRTRTTRCRAPRGTPSASCASDA